MIHLMIRHKAKAGKIGELKEAIAQCMRIWQRHGCNVLGVWTSWIGGPCDEVMYIYQFKDFADYEAIDVKAHTDSEWPDFTRKLDACSTERSTELLRPTEFSPQR